jgi:tight adherence protein B
MTYDTPEALFLVYTAVFIGVILAFEGLRQLLDRSENAREARNRRMRLVNKGASTEEILEELLSASFRSKKRSRFSLIPDFSAMMRQAGFSASPLWLIPAAAVCGGVTYALALRYIPAEFVLPLAVTSAVILPIAILHGRRGERLAKLNQQLPDALELMARGLRVGHPLNVTVQSVATDMPDPIGSEFGIVHHQVEYGDEIVDAFHDFAERVGFEDARYLAVSVGIQHGTGGNLARILSVLSRTIRDRANMRTRIKAISAEGRLSAVILTGLPVMIFGIIMTTSPDFYRDVWDDPMFPPFAIAIVSLIVLQGIILNRLVSFKF